jgi:glycosyltransferase involved in cell wall biosynthesis
VVIDGLAFGALPEEASRAAHRLRLVALVHHPLAAETGLDRATAAALADSERRALATVRRVVVTSPGTAEALSEYGVARAQISVVPPGVDRAPIARGSRSSTTHLLCVATLTPRKGHEVLLRALALLREEAWHLTCLGSTDRDPLTTAGLQRQAEASGLGGRVDFIGEADAAVVDRYYDSSDIFVLPTLYEGYGMAVAEALAHGLPVISTPTGGIEHMVGDTAGVLVPAGDAEALAEALRRVISDTALRSRLAAGAARARDTLPTWEDAARAFAAALAEVAA